MTGGDVPVAEIERVNAIDERRLVDVLATQDPSWRSTTFDLADGIAVLAGPGLFVNQCLGAGLAAAVTDADLDHLEEQSAAVGVVAAFEVSEATRRDVVQLLEARGYAPRESRTVVAHDLSSRSPGGDAIVVDTVTAERLKAWQQASAMGWGHDEPAARSANDAYAAAAFVADDPGLFIARASEDGRLLGVAALRITDGIATLGGMSTLPDARRRGVQGALVAARLERAHAAGCRAAVSMTSPGSGSLRNLYRAGFEESHTRTTWIASVRR